MRKPNERKINRVGITGLADQVEISDGWVRGNKGGGRWRGNKTVRSQRGNMCREKKIHEGSRCER